MFANAEVIFCTLLCSRRPPLALRVITLERFVQLWLDGLVILSFSSKQLASSYKTLLGTKLSTFCRDSLTFFSSFSLLYSSATSCDEETYQSPELRGLMHHLQPA